MGAEPCLTLPGLDPLPADVVAVLATLAARGHCYTLMVLDAEFLTLHVPAGGQPNDLQLPRELVADLMAAGFEWQTWPVGWALWIARTPLTRGAA